jgi:hypothetical protein
MFQAAVVKLVDTRDLKSRGSNTVRVRFPPAAPEEKFNNLINPISENSSDG